MNDVFAVSHVYVVMGVYDIEGDYESCDLIGIYTTEEGAKKCVEKLTKLIENGECGNLVSADYNKEELNVCNCFEIEEII